MRKTVLIVMAVLLSAGSWMGAYPASVEAAPYPFSDGEGTPTDPYVIMTAEELDHVRDDLAASYRLGTDIDLSPYTANWVPIGSDPFGDAFTGQFDGGHHTISGLKIVSSDVFIGLFGFASDASGGYLKNVRLVDVDITVGAGNSQAGGLVGASASPIEGVSVRGEIRGIGSTIGGLAGQAVRSVSDSEADVWIDGLFDQAGGLIGTVTSGGSVDHSYATSNVNLTGSGQAGGLVGHWSGGPTLGNSYAYGSATSQLGDVGGLVGEVYNSLTITDSYAAVELTTGGGQVGGMVGNRSGLFPLPEVTITRSYWDNNAHATAGVTGWNADRSNAVDRNDLNTWSTFATWDSAVWGIQEGAGMPYLKAFAPVLRAQPPSASYDTEPADNVLEVSGSVRDGSIGEPLTVLIEIVNSSGETVRDHVINQLATGNDETFDWQTTIDDRTYPEGAYTLRITAADTVAGQEQQQLYAFNVEDITAPAAPNITGPTEGQKLGLTRPAISGTAEAGSTVTIVLDGIDAGTAAAAGDGSWSWTPSSDPGEGAHAVRARTTDAAGNASVDSAARSFTVDTQAPVISLAGANPMLVSAGSVFTDPGATAVDAVDGPIAQSALTVTGAVNASAVGSYTLMYQVEDAAGNAGTETRTVNVVDMTPPVISLTGANPMQVTAGSVFTDPGATVADAVDGVIDPASITVAGAVNASAAGTYTLTYQAQDAAGNTASVTRTVEVVPAAPGASPAPVAARSSNAELAQLVLTSGGITLPLSPAFAPGTTVYSAETAGEHVELEWKASDPNTAVKLLNASADAANRIALEAGANSVVLAVRAEDGTEKRYTVTVTRLTAAEGGPAQEAACPFTDIQGHWAEADICEAAAQGIVEGVDKHRYAPDTPVTRVEFAVMLLRTLRVPIREAEAEAAQEAELAFRDKAGIPQWARSAIDIGVAEGMLNGYPDGTFRPERTMIRIELAAMLAKAMKWEKSGDIDLSFADRVGIPDWAQSYVAAAYEEGLMQGRAGNLFVPRGMTTRAEAAVVLLRLRHTLHR